MKSFFEPVKFQLDKNSGKISENINIHTPAQFPDWEDTDIIILGINLPDENNEETQYAPDEIRKSFYELFPGEWNLQLSDLGNIKELNELEEIVGELLVYNKSIIVLGGSQSIIYELSKSIQKINAYQNISIIDSVIDLNSRMENEIFKEKINNQNFLNFILTDPELNINNMSIIGVQKYYNNQDNLNLIEKLYIDTYNLGEIKNKTHQIEPELRDSHIIALDINSMENSSFPGQKISRPNGFSNLEICKISRLSGLSEKNKIFGIFEMNPLFDKNYLSANLSAQIIWYYIEGKNILYFNKDQEHLLKFYVKIDLLELIFYKDERTERWWVEFKDIGIENRKFACSYEDYLEATSNKLSKRLTKIIEKNKI